MGALPPEQAGAGSAVNDTTREFGGTLGVAIVGCVDSVGGGVARLPRVPEQKPPIVSHRAEHVRVVAMKIDVLHHPFVTLAH
jgi:hypothetical protein